LLDDLSEFVYTIPVEGPHNGMTHCRKPGLLDPSKIPVWRHCADPPIGFLRNMNDSILILHVDLTSVINISINWLASEIPGIRRAVIWFFRSSNSTHFFPEILHSAFSHSEIPASERTFSKLCFDQHSMSYGPLNRKR
jgi:hypothetical protein